MNINHFKKCKKLEKIQLSICNQEITQQIALESMKPMMIKSL